jgi:hypothetical protein
MIKITGLSALNTRALTEMLDGQPEAPLVDITTSAASFDMSMAEAMSVVERAKNRAQAAHGAVGHPYASLHTVTRKLEQVRKAREVAARTTAKPVTPVPTVRRTVRTPLCTFLTDDGPWLVRYIPTGGRIARPARSVVEHATVEFFDPALADDSFERGPGFGVLGQFVADYTVTTLLDIDDWHRGMNLGSSPSWTIDGPDMYAIRVWIDGRRQELS